MQNEFKNIENEKISYIDILKELIKRQSFLFDKVKKGDYSMVCYIEDYDKEYGIYDKNYCNRVKLAYYILLEHIDCEEIIKKLFEEELKDRETNDWQGIGPCLETLTFLLMKYNENGTYDVLFQRAKNANFDCACGYNENDKVYEELEQYDIEDGIFLAIDLEDIKVAEKLVELWKKKVINWDEQSYKELIWFQSYMKQEEKNEEPRKNLLMIALEKAENEQEIISTWRELIHHYVQFDQCEQAYENFINMIHTRKLTSIYHIRLFEYILEDCLELLCKYPRKAQELWEWVKPFLEERKDNMFGVLYEKSIKAAEAVNDLLAEELIIQYNTWKERVNIRK